MLNLILMVVRKWTNAQRREEASDEELMESYRDGDVDAFEVLLQRHEKKVFFFILRKVGDRERAGELLQDAFLRVIKGANSYSRKAKFTTWLYTIARNLSIDELRRMKHRRHQSLSSPMGSSDDGPTLYDKLPGPSDDGFDRADATQIRVRIESALKELNEEQREVFVMREMMNMPFKEIGVVVGVSENTVKSRMRYALEALRLSLADYAKDMPSNQNPVPKRSRV